MAWSYSEQSRDAGFIDGNDLQICWRRSWTITETTGASVGKIRLSLRVSTSEYWTWYKGYFNTYEAYCTDSIVCGNESVTIVARRKITDTNASYTATVDVPNEWAGKSIQLNIAWSSLTKTFGASKSFTLLTSAGTGSSITVNRTASNVGATGDIVSGATIYNGDSLKITFIPSANYGIVTHTVNGTSFTSGNTHSVSTDVSVAATAQPLASDVGATDANIGSVSTITVTKHSTSYYHSLQYSFGGLTGYITSSGGVSSTEVKFSSTSIAFTVPTSFYAKIPNAKTGTCTITCRTYATFSSTTTLGDAKTCTFTVTAAEADCSPTVSGTVVDTNATTVALTGDSNILVRYKSTATCTITATARQSSTIASRKIQNQTPNSNNVLTVSGDSLSSGSFSFSATCSRGYTTTASVSKTLVAYIKLTLNPVVYRPAPTTGEIALTLSGNYYGGSFGAYSNTLTIRYRYRETTVSTWSSWITVAANKYSKTSRAYSTSNPILLADSNGSTTGFDYQKSYYFQIQAYDGANGTTLTSVSSTVTVQRGIPVFDWGESDFNFNVPVKIDGINLIDIFYPVGSVYMTANTSLPSPAIQLRHMDFCLNRN